MVEAGGRKGRVSRHEGNSFFLFFPSGQAVGRPPGCILYCDILRFILVVITPSLPAADTFYRIITFIVRKVPIDASSHIMLNVITYARF